MEVGLLFSRGKRTGYEQRFVARTQREGTTGDVMQVPKSFALHREVAFNHGTNDATGDAKLLPVCPPLMPVGYDDGPGPMLAINGAE
jgi:hypothetical protein